VLGGHARARPRRRRPRPGPPPVGRGHGGRGPYDVDGWRWPAAIRTLEAWS